jgi:tetratricopeptide (TPR) repeat protein
MRISRNLQFITPLRNTFFKNFPPLFPSLGTPGEGKGGGFSLVTLLATLLLLSACSSNPQSRQQLDAGESALQNRQYDQALRDAEADYLRGRALENRPKPDPTAALQDLAAARSAYTAALSHQPSRQLEPILHGQLGNVSFYMDDYAAAHREWTLAYGSITDPQLKESLLYGIGVCQQRLGRFADADQTFEKVQAAYPNTDYAQRARAHQGVSGFYVQVGAFRQSDDADRAAAAIRAVGSLPLMTVRNNLTIIRTPDVPTYAQAMELRSRLKVQYPDARVMP